MEDSDDVDNFDIRHTLRAAQSIPPMPPLDQLENLMSSDATLSVANLPDDMLLPDLDSLLKPYGTSQDPVGFGSFPSSPAPGSPTALSSDTHLPKMGSFPSIQQSELSAKPETPHIKGIIFENNRKWKMQSGKKILVCEIEGCKFRASFGFKKGEDPSHCKKHSLPSMVDVKNKKCVFDGCTKLPSFGVPGMTATHCKEHAKPGMNVHKSKLCEGDGCKSRSYFNYPGLKSRFCRLHSLPGMVIQKSRKCQEETCNGRPSYGLPGGKPQCCAEHKKPGMVNTRHRRCQEKGCTKWPCYAMPGKSVKFCKEHAREGMVDVQNRRCEFDGCRLRAFWGLPGEVPIRCDQHITIEMVYRGTTCKQVACKKKPQWGPVGTQRAEYCDDHKLEGMEIAESMPAPSGPGPGKRGKGRSSVRKAKGRLSTQTMETPEGGARLLVQGQSPLLMHRELVEQLKQGPLTANQRAIQPKPQLLAQALSGFGGSGGGGSLTGTPLEGIFNTPLMDMAASARLGMSLSPMSMFAPFSQEMLEAVANGGGVGAGESLTPQGVAGTKRKRASTAKPAKSDSDSSSSENSSDEEGVSVPQESPAVSNTPMSATRAGLPFFPMAPGMGMPSPFSPMGIPGMQGMSGMPNFANMAAIMKAFPQMGSLAGMQSGTSQSPAPAKPGQGDGGTGPHSPTSTKHQTPNSTHLIASNTKTQGKSSVGPEVKKRAEQGAEEALKASKREDGNDTGRGKAHGTGKHMAKDMGAWLEEKGLGVLSRPLHEAFEGDMSVLMFSAQDDKAQFEKDMAELGLTLYQRRKLLMALKSV